MTCAYRWKQGPRTRIYTRPSSMLLKIFGLFCIGILIAVVVDILYDLDFHLHLYKVHPGVCKNVNGVNYGSEDFHVLSDGLTFITSGVEFPRSSPGYAEYLLKNNIKGRVYQLDLKNPENSLRELKIKTSPEFNPDSFRPHGLGVWEDKVNREHLLYVVNHVPGESDRIEKLRYSPDTHELQHLKSFRSDLIRLANDIVVTSDAEDTFYLTNFYHYPDGVSGVLEKLFRLPFGNVLYFDGSNFTVAASGLYAPNGVIVSKDRKYLYVLTSSNKAMLVFERSSNNSLLVVQNVGLRTVPDNAQMSQDGRTLFVGAHPIKWKLLNHMIDPVCRAPSMVLACPLKDGKVVEDQISQIFYDHGDLITASSVGVVFNNKLLIGSIMDKMVVCDLNRSPL